MRTTTTTRRIMTCIAAAVLAVGAMTGCTSQTYGDESAPTSGGGERLAGSYDELLQQYLDKEANPFVIDVLKAAIETGGITQAQYDEAHRMYTDCMVSAGFKEEHTRLASGIIQITPPNMNAEEAQKYREVSSECADELAPIEALYGTQQGNPDLLTNGDEIVVACFKRSKIVDASYSTEDLAKDLDTRFENAPYAPMDAAVQECFSAGGYAVALGDQ